MFLPDKTLQFIAALLFLSACQFNSPVSTITPSPESLLFEIQPMIIATMGSEVRPTETISPTIEPAPTDIPRILTICIGSEPETLYVYGASMLVENHILQAIYDGPIDRVSYGYQTQLLEKIPSLADGDAVISPVTVSKNDTVVDHIGQIVALTNGVLVRPAGCRSEACVVNYSGGNIEMDQLSVSFTLHSTISWSDGTPLTALDSIYSFQVAKATNALNVFSPKLMRESLEKTESYETLDTYSVEWRGLPGFLDPNYRDNFWFPMPKHVWGQLTANELLENPLSTRQPLGWGPYVLQEWVEGSHILMARNTNYFRTGEGLPRFEQLIFRFVGYNANKNLDMLLNGACDILDRDTRIDMILPELLQLDRSGLIQLGFTPDSVYEHLDFGIQPASYDNGLQPSLDRPDFFSDSRVRQAFAHCIDREAINELHYGGKAEIPQSYVSSAHPLFNLSGPLYLYDPAKGRNLLEAAGWIDHDNDPGTPRRAANIDTVPEKTIFSITLLTIESEFRNANAAIIREGLQSCGIDIKLVSMGAGDFYTNGPAGQIFGRKFDLAMFAWQNDIHPPCQFWMSSNVPGDTPQIHPSGWDGINLTGYKNDLFDETCNKAINALPGTSAYEEEHLLAQEIFMQDLPIIPLISRLKVVAARPDICGLNPDPTIDSELWNIEQFDFGEICE